jgi:FkbM family methyltransferase
VTARDLLQQVANSLGTEVSATLIDTEIGAVLLHADDEVMTPWIKHYRTWEVEETGFIRAYLRPGDTFIDCGANFGWFSLIGSSIVGPRGRVIAIEPDPSNLALLRANLWSAHADNTEIIAAAAGAGRGIMTLRFDPVNRGNHQVHPIEDRAGRMIPVVALDELLAGERVDLVKIDVQGFDHEVVAGLHATLAANPHARVLVEFWVDGMRERNIDTDAVLAGYRAAGFTVAALVDSGATAPCTDDEIYQLIAANGLGFANLVLTRS